MGIVGEVFGRFERQIATLETTLDGEILRVEVKIDGIPRVEFPMPATADINEVALRAGNVVNQTNLVDNPCRVEARDEPE